LFSRPRRSPKPNADSRQASICGGSRRQSSVPRGTGTEAHDSTSSLHNSSPATRGGRFRLPASPPPPIDTPTSAASRTTLDAGATESTSMEHLTPPRHHQVMRESRSLDPFPDGRTDPSPHLTLQLPKSSRSLENCVGSSGCKLPSSIKSRHVINNNHPNGDILPATGDISAEDVRAPLLGNDINNSPVLQHEAFPDCVPAKRWHSLEEVPGSDSMVVVAGGGGKKAAVSRGSIRSWLAGLFNGNGLRTSDTSLRKGIHGHAYGDLQSEKESIV